jgi:hypothetical protein
MVEFLEDLTTMRFEVMPSGFLLFLADSIQAKTRQKQPHLQLCFLTKFSSVYKCFQDPNSMSQLPHTLQTSKTSSKSQNSIRKCLFSLHRLFHRLSVQINSMKLQSTPRNTQLPSVSTNPRKCLERRLINDFILDPKTSFYPRFIACQKLCARLSRRAFKIINLDDNYENCFVIYSS